MRSPSLRRSRQRFRLLALAAAISLGAASCGSDGGDTPQDAASEATPTTAETTTTDTSASSESTASTSTESAADDSSADAADTDEAEDAPASDDDAEPVENFFPDIDVTNVADGSSVNLAAELGGGDKATLLWFYAPH